MSMSQKQFGAFCRNLEEITQRMREILLPREAEEKCVSSPDAKDAVEGFDVKFSSLSLDDVALMGLGLCRLEEAADDFIESEGELEGDLFPCDESDDEAVESNMADVRKARRRSGQLKIAMAKLHSDIIGSLVHANKEGFK